VQTGGAAARHLFRSACGLDSAVRGEGQILTQLRRTFDAARANGLDPMLTALVQRALHVARELRATTALGMVRRSVGSLAVEAAIALVADPRGVTALVVGAGEVGKLASRVLAARVGEIVIANRDLDRAREVARPLAAEVVPLTSLEDALGRSALVISAADTRGAVLTRALLERRLERGPLVVVDVAVPRSVPADARGLSGLVYRSVDDLVDAATPLDDATVRAAEARCELEAERFARDREARGVARTIEALHGRGDELRRRQLARALAKLGHLDERDRRVVASLSSALTRALLHAPTVALRDSPERADAARALFGIEETA
jgi:glutamyl-tRNA reductase